MDIKRIDVLTTDLIGENSMLIAPKEFTALLASFVQAIENNNYLEVAQIYTLMINWLKTPGNAKRLSLIINIGST